MEIDLSKLSKDYTNYVWAFAEKPPKEDLQYLVVDCRLPEVKISKILNASKSNVSRWKHFYNIQTPPPIVDAPDISKEMLNQLDMKKLSRNFLETPWKKGEEPLYSDFHYLYIELNWSQNDMAKFLGLSRSRVVGLLDKLGISKTMDLHQQSREKMNMRKYGTPHTIAMKETREKIENSNMKKYGAKTVLCYKEYREDAMEKKYGVKHPLQSQQFMDKMILTNVSRRGVAYTTQDEETKEKMKKTTMEHYGVPNISQCEEGQKLIKEGCMNSLGVSSPAKSEKIREKMQATNGEKYGCKFASQAESVKEKIANTNEKKYGYKCTFQVPELREKGKATMLNEYGTLNTGILHVKHRENMNKEFWESAFKDPRSGAFDTGKCALYHGIHLNTVRKYMDEFGITMRRKGGSLKEIEIQKVFVDLDVPVERHNRTVLGGKELDLYSPAHNLAIEYDGIMYHSQGRFCKGAINDYPISGHLQKTRDCEKQGIQLLHIFDTEWLNPLKRDIWKSMITARLGFTDKIYARKTVIEQITSKDAEQFCEENHLQGGCRAKVNLALIDPETCEIVSVMTFTPPRFNKTYDWELVRYCNKKYTSVIGGASKLLKYFREHYSGSIISYANRRWSQGKLYENLGFTLIGESRPNYFYFITVGGNKPADYVLHSRIEFQKAKLKDKLPVFDENLSEKDNMYMNNYRSIYDCGSKVYELK